MHDLTTEYETFIIAPYWLTEPTSILILLTDYKFWAEREKELHSWNQQMGNIYTIKGSTLICNVDHALTTFILKWN